MIQKKDGFTLIELMVVITIIGILVSYGIPSYERYVVKSKRTAAQSALLKLAASEEKHNANYNQYTINISGSGTDGNSLGLGTAEFMQASDNYSYAITGVNGYTISATAKAGTSQVKDNYGINCTNISLNSLGQKVPLACWR